MEKDWRNTLVFDIRPDTGRRRRGTTCGRHTGLSGSFRVEAEWTVRRDDGLPTVFTAVREQLGLRLEPRVEPVEIVVIDSVERPTPN